MGLSKFLFLKPNRPNACLFIFYFFIFELACSLIYFVFRIGILFFILFILSIKYAILGILKSLNRVPFPLATLKPAAPIFASPRLT